VFRSLANANAWNIARAFPYPPIDKIRAAFEHIGYFDVMARRCTEPAGKLWQEFRPAEDNPLYVSQRREAFSGNTLDSEPTPSSGGGGTSFLTRPSRSSIV
jgi:hypothetical protein